MTITEIARKRDAEPAMVPPMLPADKASRLPEIVVQFYRYVLIGGLAFVIDFTILQALTELADVYYLYAATVGFLVGLLVNYWLSTRWVFSYRKLSDRRAEFIIFGVIGLLGLALNNLSLYAMTEFLSIDYRISKLLTAGIVLAFNFLLRRALLFTRS